MQTEKDKLIRFYSLLPEDYVEDAIESLQVINRDIRRKYSRNKTLVDKLIFIDKYKDKNLQLQLLSCLYSHYKNSIQFSENDSFETVLSSYNKGNCISNTIYLLYRCCRNEGNKFNNKKILLLLESNQFNDTINNTWNSISSAVASLSVGSNELSDNYSNELKTDIIVEENKKMNTYLGYIEKSKTFFNFKPEYILKNDKLEVIDEITAKTMFPDHGEINLRYYTYNETGKYLDNLNIDNDLFAFIFADEEIEDNTKSDGELNQVYQRRVDLSNLTEKLENRIINVNDINIYKIVTSVNEITNSDFVDGIIEIDEDYVEGEQVLLKKDNKLYGPYKLNERLHDGIKYVQPKVGPLSGYLCKYYNYNPDDAILFNVCNNESYKKVITYRIPPNIDGKEDIIPDSILLSKMEDPINFDLIPSNTDEFIRLFENSPYLSSKVNQNFKASRVERIRNILMASENFDSEKRKIALELINLVKSNKAFETVITESDLYNDLNTSYRTLRGEKEELENRVNSLSEENTQLQIEIADCESNGSAKSQIEADENKRRCDELKKQIADFEEKLGAYSKLQDIEKRIENRTGALDVFEKQCNTKQEAIRKMDKEKIDLEDKVKAAIVKGKNEAQLAFDPFISNALLDEAAKWRTKSENDQYDEIVRNIDIVVENTPCKNKDALIQHLVEYVRKVRKYPVNDIINMYICLAQGFLTVFSGEPGTGKTSICNILASSLGLLNVRKKDDNKGYDTRYNRFIPVSVERGWSSKRDLIGYFNPLTRKYNASNGKIYDSLMILDKEKENSKLSYIILLDEANLSPMEYYWSDFMRPADAFDGKTSINIGIERDIFIPNTLKFLATINNDQTTEKLSPRVIDRAWVIKLPTEKIELNKNSELPESTDLILWSDFCSAFTKTTDVKMTLDSVASEVYGLFEKYNLNVSPRIRLSIEKYVCAAQEIMEDESGRQKKQIALDYAIVQKLLPKIDGEYSKMEVLFKELKRICEENNLTKTKEALDKMELVQEQNMGYCQFMA